MGRRAVFPVAQDVLQHHHRVVHQHAEGERQTGERQHVDRDLQVVQGHHGHRQRRRDRSEKERRAAQIPEQDDQQKRDQRQDQGKAPPHQPELRLHVGRLVGLGLEGEIRR